MKIAIGTSLILFLALLCGCGPQPVVGKWQEQGPMQLQMEFLADGTVKLHVDIPAIIKESEKKSPNMGDRILGIMTANWERMVNQDITWKKVKKNVYALTFAEAPYRGEELRYVTLVNDELIGCDADGQPVGQAKFTRVPAP